MLRTLQRKARTAYVFESERGTPMSIRSAQWTVEEAGRDAGLPLPVDIHMLRHNCGYKLANDGHSALPRAQEPEPHGALHGAGAGSVPGILARLI
jgi:site-specific recombinase XerC